MTLLLASVSNEAVLITSDGVSIVESLNAPGRTTLQKIFPIPSRPMAIAQCGGNFLNVEARGQVSIAKAIGEWYDSELPQTVHSIAECLNKWIRAADKDYFTRCQPKLWVAGYSEESCRPDFCILTNQGVEQRKQFHHTAGAGGDFLRHKSWCTHAEAWDIAMAGQKRQKQSVFGGRRQQLRITPAGCTWLEKPTRGNLGIEGEILPSVDIPPRAKVADARCYILSARDELQTELCCRVLKPKGKHARTYQEAKKYWNATRTPDWHLTDRLIAVCDEARFAHPCDVSKREAVLYREHVRRVINSLLNAIDDV